MTGIKLFDGMYGGLEQVLDLRSRQHALTAANLSNADTPGYQAKEIDFDHLLRNVMERAIDATDPVSESEIEVEVRELPPWARDGNSVDAERETAKMASNTLMYNAVVTGIDHRLSMLRFAASDGKI
jgi:flagellar basal-body rod protein FlgB